MQKSRSTLLVSPWGSSCGAGASSVGRGFARSGVIAALAVLMALGAWGCKHSAETGNGAGDRVETGASGEAKGPPIVVFEPEGGSKAAVLVEVVRTPETIQRGLMYRKQMDRDHGMLFLMPEEEVQSFWMRNTYIPLDMIFVDSDKVVVGVVENARPLTDTSRTVGKPSIYVIEVNAGWAADHGVGAGTRVRFKNIRE